MAREGFFFEIEVIKEDTSPGVSMVDFPEWEEIFSPLGMIDSSTRMQCAGIEIMAEKVEGDDDVEVICWDRKIKKEGKIIRRIRDFYSTGASRGTGEMMSFDHATQGMDALLNVMWKKIQTDEPYVVRVYCVADLRAPEFISAALDAYYGRNKNKEEN